MMEIEQIEREWRDVARELDRLIERLRATGDHALAHLADRIAADRDDAGFQREVPGAAR